MIPERQCWSEGCDRITYAVEREVGYPLCQEHGGEWHESGWNTTVQDMVVEPPAWTPSEPDEIIAEFSKLLRLATGDGAKKRKAGKKPCWKYDDSHMGAFHRHLRRYMEGEKVDADSGADPRVHCAWRLLAAAWRDANPVAVASGTTPTLTAPTKEQP